MRFVNCKRGTHRFSPLLPKSTPKSHDTDTSSTVNSIISQPTQPSPPCIPTRSSNGNFKCTYCPKEYKQNGRWLHNHIN